MPMMTTEVFCNIWVKKKGIRHKSAHLSKTWNSAVTALVQSYLGRKGGNLTHVPIFKKPGLWKYSLRIFQEVFFHFWVERWIESGNQRMVKIVRWIYSIFVDPFDVSTF